MSAVSCTHDLSALLVALKQQDVTCETAVTIKPILKSITIHHDQGQFPGLFVPLKGENKDGHVYLHEYLMKNSQNIALCATYFKSQISAQDKSRVIFVDNPLQALQQWAIAYRKTLPIQGVAITGSSGKTTFKDLLVSVLAQKFRVIGTHGNLNNHIGVPLTVLSLLPDTQISVFELGMNHPGEIAALVRISRPTVGAILNVGQAHVGLLGSVENVAKAKGELAQYITEQGGKVYGLTPYRRWFDETLAKQMIWINPERVSLECWAFESSWELKSEMGKLDLAKGGIGQETLALALTLANHFGLSPGQIWEGIKQFSCQDRGLRGSLKELGKHWIFLDCYNANPDSFKFSLTRACHLAREVPASGFIGWYGDMGELGVHALDLHRMSLELLLQTSYPQAKVQYYFLGSWFQKAFDKLSIPGDRAKQFHFLADITQARQTIETLLSQQTPQFFHVKASRASQLERLFEPYLSYGGTSPMVK